MLKDAVLKKINKQISFEFYSSYIYLSMSAYCASKNLKGFANWMHVQAQEELFHAEKMFNYIIDRGGKVVLEAIDQPANEWDSIVDVFADAYKHEQLVTSRINDIMDVAMQERDHATTSFIKWFIDEQVEEEANASEMVDNLTMVKDAPQALFMLDREAGQRVFTPPTATTA